MKLTQTVAAAEAPITLAEARSWLSMQSGVTQDDVVLTTVIGEITDYLEDRLNGRKLIDQTWTIQLDAEEIGAEIHLPLLPMTSVTSIATTDDAGDDTTVNATNYQYRTGNAPRIVLSPTGSWPTMRAYDSMLITAVFGYGDAADLPADIVQLVKDLTLFRYTTKGTGVTQTVSGQLMSVPGVTERQITALRVEPW